ncbi:MAG TPA: hypothetical protein VKA46_27590 [Gemmataceae bacterium]|nr:hypothetical protein [Gemmataceae bacterium]
MNDVATTVSKVRATPAGIVCRLRKKAQGRAAASPLAGEVELENVSGDVLEIEVQTSPLQYLDLLVSNAAGELLSGWRYGECFSPVELSYTFCLGPREKYTAPVSLLGNVPQAKRLPGTYLIQAVYEYKGARGVSEVFRLDYRPAQRAE